MATFPDGHEGAWPVNADTATGRFRLLIGDVNGVEYDPAESGYRSYTLSDAQIDAYIAQGGGESVTRGIAFYYFKLAGDAAQEAVSIQDQDLRVDQTKKSAALAEIARFWLDQGDNDDAISAEEAFEIVPTGVSSGGFIPEGSPAMWGREYTIGRWIR